MYSKSEEGYGDEKKLFKILERERLKKPKYNHTSVIPAPVYADFDLNGMPGIGYNQHPQRQKQPQCLGSKRKRKSLGSTISDIKQKTIRRKEGESSSD